MTLLLILLASVILATAASSEGANQRIVNGDIVTPHSYPWQLSLRDDGHHICGASLIAPNFAVTAAHCVHPNQPERYKVVCGAHDIGLDEDTTQFLDVEAVYRHENYSASSQHPAFPNDISLLRLATNATLDDYCQLAKLPEPGRDYGNMKGVITGWGRLYGNGPSPARLRKAPVTFLTHEECHSNEQFGFGDTIGSDVHICAYDIHFNGYYGACNGDSGGPAQTEDDTLVGVASFVAGYCYTQYPSVYTRLSSYLDWMKDIMETN